MKFITRSGAALILALLTTSASVAAEPQQFSARHIDQLVAPIALYPDPLLDKMLMASTYPNEVWESAPCDPWPVNAGPAPPAGARAAQREFDPSVQSLAPFPQILCLMGSNYLWTESLGETVIYSRARVFDEIQKLRRLAKANGNLVSNAKEVVTDSNGVIVIEPADPATLSVPEYDPNKAFGAWPDPKRAPETFSSFPAPCALAAQGYCWMTWTIVPALWGWDRWDWAGHRLLIDPARYTLLNNGVAPTRGEVWRHDPAHRRGAEYSPPHPLPAFALPPS